MYVRVEWYRLESTITIILDINLLATSIARGGEYGY